MWSGMTEVVPMVKDDDARRGSDLNNYDPVENLAWRIWRISEGGYAWGSSRALENMIQFINVNNPGWVRGLRR